MDYNALLEQIRTERERRNALKNQANLGLDGRVIPQAPQMPNFNEAEQSVLSGLGNEIKRFGNQALNSIEQGLDSLGNATGKALDIVANPFINAYGSVYKAIDEKGYHRDSTANQIAQLENQINGGLVDNAIDYVLGNENEAKQELFRSEAFKIARANGYEPFIYTKPNGEQIIAGRDKNGDFADLTPDLMQSIWASKGEILGSVVGGTGGAKLGTQLASKAMSHLGQKATKAGAILGAGGVGASAGAFSDLTNAENITGYEQSFNERAKEALMRGVDDMVGGAVVGTALKGLGKAYQGIKQPFIKANEAYNKAQTKIIDGVEVVEKNKKNALDTIKQFTPNFITNKIDGGMSGAKSYANDMLRTNDKVNFDETMRNLESIPLGQNPKNVFFQNTSEILENKALDTQNETLRNLYNQAKNISDTLGSKTTSQGVLDDRATLLKQSLGDEALNEQLLNIIQREPKLATKMAEILGKNADDFIKSVEAKEFNTDNIYQAINDNFTRIKSEYGQGLKQIDTLTNGKITLDETSKKELNKLFDSVNFNGEALSAYPNIRENFKNALSDLETNGIKSLEQVQSLIEITNQALKSKSATSVNKNFYTEAKKILRNAIARSGGENSKEITKILNTINKNYSQMKKLENSNIGGKLKGNQSEVLNKFLKSANETNKDLDFEAMFKGLNAKERTQLENELFNGVLENRKLETSGKNSKRFYDYQGIKEDLEKIPFTSEAIKTKKAVVDFMANYQSRNLKIAKAIEAKVLNKGSSGSIQGTDIPKRVIINFISSQMDLILGSLGTFMRLGKEAAFRVQLRRAISGANSEQSLLKRLEQIKAPKGKEKEFKSEIDNLASKTKNAEQEFKDKVSEYIQGKGFVTKETKPLTKEQNKENNNATKEKFKATNAMLKKYGLKQVDFKPNIEPKEPLKSENIKLDNTSKTLEKELNLSDEVRENIVKNLINNTDIALKLSPNFELLNVVKDFSKPIKTPLFESKINMDILLNHLSDKTQDLKRLEYINLIKPSLEKPLFIVKENDRFKFFKTFIDDDKVVKFLSVIENNKGEFLGITATPLKNTDLRKLLKGDIIWGGDTLSALSTPQIAKQGKNLEAEAMSKTLPQTALKENKAKTKLDEIKETIDKVKGENKSKESDNLQAYRALQDKVSRQKESLQERFNALTQSVKEKAENKPLKDKIEAVKKVAKQKAEKEAKQEAKAKAKVKEVADKLESNSKENPNSAVRKKKEVVKKSMFDNLFNATSKKKESEQEIENIKNRISEIIKAHRTYKHDYDKTYKNDMDLFKSIGKERRLTKWKEAREQIEKEFNMSPIKEFGENYAEHYRNRNNAVSKLLETKKGQVAGAFYRKDLGDIDLVWGEVSKDKNGNIKGFGLAKIFEKHAKNGDFDNFRLYRDTLEMTTARALSEIIEKGEVITKNNVSTIIYHKDNKEFRIGISKGWNNQGDNKWIITAYDNKNYQGKH